MVEALLHSVRDEGLLTRRALVIGLAIVVLVVGVGVLYRVLGSTGTEADTVPASITGDCSKPVDEEINAFMATVPDGGLIRFPPDACYGLAGSITLTERSDLTVDGQGSTFKILTPGQWPGWLIQAGEDITLLNTTIRGTNNVGFDSDVRPPFTGGQHGYEFEAVQGARLLHAKAYDTEGDPVAVGPDVRSQDRCTTPPNRNILIDDLYAFNSGRTASITHADGVTIRNSYFGDIFDNAIDIETDDDCMMGRNIRILDNRFGRFHYAMVANTGADDAGHGGGLEVSGNVTEHDPSSCFPAILVQPPTNQGKVRHNYVIRNNRLRALGSAVVLYDVRGGRIESNTFSKNYGGGCTRPEDNGETFAVRLYGSENVNVYGNKLDSGPDGGFAGEVKADGFGITQARPDSLPPLPPLPAVTHPQPTITVTAPVDGATVSGTVDIVATAGGNIRRVEFMVDGKLVRTDSPPNYGYQWDTRQVANGAHSIAATAYNVFQEEVTHSVTVTVRNVP